MPVVAIGEGDALMLRIDGEDTAVAQRDAPHGCRSDRVSRHGN